VDSLDDDFVQSVSRMCEFGSMVNLDIFTVGSRREGMRFDGAVNGELDGGHDVGCPKALNITGITSGR